MLRRHIVDHCSTVQHGILAPVGNFYPHFTATVANGDANHRGPSCHSISTITLAVYSQSIFTTFSLLARWTNRNWFRNMDEGAKKCGLDIAICEGTSPLPEISCHMGSHSVTCYPTAVTFPPLPQSKLYSILQPRKDAKLSWPSSGLSHITFHSKTSHIWDDNC